MKLKSIFIMLGFIFLIGGLGTLSFGLLQQTFVPSFLSIYENFTLNDYDITLASPYGIGSHIRSESQPWENYTLNVLSFQNGIKLQMLIDSDNPTGGSATSAMNMFAGAVILNDIIVNPNNFEELSFDYSYTFNWVCDLVGPSVQTGYEFAHWDMITLNNPDTTIDLSNNWTIYSPNTFPQQGKINISKNFANEFLFKINNEPSTIIDVPDENFNLALLNYHTTTIYCVSHATLNSDLAVYNIELFTSPIATPYWRFSNNVCNEISLSPSEVTSNDYSTQALCETHIEIPQNNTNQTQQNNTQQNNTNNQQNQNQTQNQQNDTQQDTNENIIDDDITKTGISMITLSGIILSFVGVIFLLFGFL